MDSLKSVIRDDLSCHICTEDYKEYQEDRVPMILCTQQHSACRACTKKIILTRGKCPLCNSPIAENTVQPFRYLIKMVKASEQLKKQNEQKMKMKIELENKINLERERDQLKQKIIDSQTKMKIDKEKIVYQNYCNKNLHKFPEELWHLTKLKVLRLNENFLVSLPQGIEALGPLTQLYLSKNQLQKLPQSLENLIQLQVLCIEQNRITQLPKGMGKLVSLQNLYMQKNKIQKFPEGFNKLKSLVKFRLDLDLLPSPYIFRQQPMYSFVNLEILSIHYQKIDKDRLKVIELSCKEKKISLHKDCKSY